MVSLGHVLLPVFGAVHAGGADERAHEQPQALVDELLALGLGLAQRTQQDAVDRAISVMARFRPCSCPATHIACSTTSVSRSAWACITWATAGWREPSMVSSIRTSSRSGRESHDRSIAAVCAGA